MSDDFINQLTLNFLISKNQLNKLNKKVKENAENTRKTDKEIYGPRIKKLFDDLLVNEPPEILLQEVKTGFDYFIDKSIYYFKALDNNELLEKERTNDYPSNHIIHDDIDYEKDERSIERGDYKEKSEEEDEEDAEDGEEEDVEDDDEEDDDVDEEKDIVITKKIEKRPPVIVKNKYNKKNNSVGVDDIQKLPLDWFQNVRENYKKNQIIPRKKDITFGEQTFRDQKKKI
jgi:hypothetical protein